MCIRDRYYGPYACIYGLSILFLSDLHRIHIGFDADERSDTGCVEIKRLKFFLLSVPQTYME